jgi:N-acetylglucosamine kinase-like BadF-type ATPase
MILIVDSGSTKSDWILLNNSIQTHYSTMGLNPYFHDEDTVYTAIKNQKELFAIREEVEKVFFYGAGCSSESLNLIIQNGLSRVFSKAAITVDHDLCACAYATYEGEPSISCIIGTGSNSCYYDGNEIYEEVPALGYILGDEGSGTYFGKQLLSNFLYKRLPLHIHEAFLKETGITKDEIVDNVYMQPNANVYLASFMRFIIKFQDDEYIKEMIYNGFKHFIQIHVCCYSNYKSVKVHFVGSIAHLFISELDKACSVMDVQLGKVIQKPIDGLVSYHENLLIHSN